MPDISVIVPIYKVEKHIDRCIESIVSQTYDSLEVILVNDGSPDNCGRICDIWAQKDKRIKVVHKNNGGLVSARKAGLDIAKGEFIAFVDGDDWVEPTMYESMINMSRKTKADITICSFIEDGGSWSKKIDNNIASGVYAEDKKHELISKAIYSGNFFEFGLYPAVWNKLFKREILLNNQYGVKNTINMGEDAACTFPALIDANCICIMESSYFYHYRKVGDSMTTKYDHRYFERIFELFKYLDEVITKKQCEVMNQQLQYYVIYLYFIGIQQEFSKQNRGHFLKKSRKVKEVSGNEYVSDAITKIDNSTMSLKYKLLAFCTKKHYALLTGVIIYLSKAFYKILKV
ncbi:glycosyltransferase family 2 protein [Priestia megaterium]|uniref:glycosyltransferase family 2 protein n=1 Tax=Priestia megaterium TaxID=1404 RepID=UPI003D05CD4C